MPTRKHAAELLAPILLRLMLLRYLHGQPDELIEATAVHIEYAWLAWLWPLLLRLGAGLRPTALPPAPPEER